MSRLMVKNSFSIHYMVELLCDTNHVVEVEAEGSCHSIVDLYRTRPSRSRLGFVRSPLGLLSDIMMFVVSYDQV